MLRHDEAAGVALHASLQSGPVDWRRVVWLASSHYVLPSLTSGLHRHGVFAEVPPEVGEALDAARYLNRDRNQTLRTALIEISRTLNPLGLEPLLLKGAMALLPGQYPGAEDRMIGDLDLWIPPSRHAEATEALLKLGYRSAQESWQWMLPRDRQAMHHDIPLLHPELPIKIELHRRLLHNPVDDEPLTQLLQPTTFEFSGGGFVSIPDSLTRLRHNFLHAQITDRQQRARRLNLRQLLEFASLAQHHAQDVDLDRVTDGLRPLRHRALAEYWAQAEYWLKVPIPTKLPRSPHQARELWLTEKVATHRGWHRLFSYFDLLCRLPRRLGSLGIRLLIMPRYYPAKIKQFLQTG